MEVIEILIVAFMVRLGYYFLKFLNWLDALFQKPFPNLWPALFLVCIAVAGIIFVAAAHRRLSKLQPERLVKPGLEKSTRIVAILLLIYLTFEAFMLLRTFGLLNDPRYQELMYPISAYQFAAIVLFVLILGTVFLLRLRAITLPLLLLALILQLGHMLITLVQHPYLAAHFARSLLIIAIKFGVPLGLAIYGWKQGIFAYSRSN